MTWWQRHATPPWRPGWGTTARQVFKELLADAVTDALQRNTGDILEQIDAEVAGLTSENLDLIAPGDLVRTLLTERRLGGTPRRHV
ncbi:hypothetical protein ACFRNT_10385 [Streptomyces sp. NPDC056697]|uniref:hypothetical protein n=1 Tax=Streptomyces sp. NPDC056697 TaxID=3345915 RepID=UPI0036A6BC5D